VKSSPLQCGGKFVDVGGTLHAFVDELVTHPFISLMTVKPRSLGILAVLALLAACSNEATVMPSTVVDAQPVTETTLEAVTTTSQPEATTTSTTTTVPATTTTVLDIACIKTTTCQYANLVGVDFSRLKLDFVDFSVATLTGASFVGTNLTNSIFIRADLSAANFEGATLKNVDFTAAMLDQASFKGANLEGAVLCDVNLETVLDLTKEQLEKVKKFKTKGKVYCP
jgi:hypothetical protein